MAGHVPQEDANLVVKIKDLKEGLPEGWQLKARVLTKTAPAQQRANNRWWTSVFLQDDTGKLRAVCHNVEEEEARQIYDAVEVCSEYWVSGCAVEKDDEKMSFPSKSEYKLILSDETEFSMTRRILRRQYQFVPIADLKAGNDLVDVIGVLGPVYQLDINKRDVIIADRSGAKVVLTLWNEQGSRFRALPGSILAVQNARVSNYYDVNLSTCDWTVVTVIPRIPEANALFQWEDVIFENLDMKSTSFERNMWIEIVPDTDFEVVEDGERNANPGMEEREADPMEVVQAENHIPVPYDAEEPGHAI